MFQHQRSWGRERDRYTERGFSLSNWLPTGFWPAQKPNDCLPTSPVVLSPPVALRNTLQHNILNLTPIVFRQTDLTVGLFPIFFYFPTAINITLLPFFSYPWATSTQIKFVLLCCIAVLRVMTRQFYYLSRLLQGTKDAEMYRDAQRFWLYCNTARTWKASQASHVANVSGISSPGWVFGCFQIHLKFIILYVKYPHTQPQRKFSSGIRLSTECPCKVIVG